MGVTFSDSKTEYNLELIWVDKGGHSKGRLKKDVLKGEFMWIKASKGGIEGVKIRV